MSDDCIFCKILRGEIPSDVVHEGENVIAFRDINPQAPVHVLVIPRRHIPTIEDFGPGDHGLIGEIFDVSREVARQEGIADEGYRTVFNCRDAGCQDVYHVHLHVLGGRQMTWPPG